MIYPYNNTKPKIHEDAFVSPSADIIGDVTIGSEAGVWFQCVIRGDVNYIEIGNRTNVQDGTVIHVTRKKHPTIIGADVTIGHKALLHGCRVSDESFIGMGATLLDGVLLEKHAMVAAGSVVTPNKIVPSGEIWAGNPAKFFRKMTSAEIDFILISSNNYVKHTYEYRKIIV